MNRDQVPGTGLRTVTDAPFTSQPGICRPTEPHCRPLGSMTVYPKFADPVKPRRGPGGCGAGFAGACAPCGTVTCEPAGTDVEPPASAVTRTVPSSVLKVTVVTPFTISTSVSKVVPRTAAVELGVLISNLLSPLSFCTEAQVFPSVCSIVTWIPPLPVRLRLATFTCAPDCTVSVLPSKNVTTALPALFARTTSPDERRSPSRAGAKSAVPFCASTFPWSTVSVAAFAIERPPPRGKNRNAPTATTSTSTTIPTLFNASLTLAVLAVRLAGERSHSGVSALASAPSHRAGPRTASGRATSLRGRSARARCRPPGSRPS